MATWHDLAALLAGLGESTGLRLILLAVAADWVTGVAAALRRGRFNLAQVGQVFASDVLPYALAYGGLALLVGGDPVLGPWLLPAAWAVAMGALVGSIRANLAELGVAVPDLPLPPPRGR
jgi:hypothetical protein